MNTWLGTSNSDIRDTSNLAERKAILAWRRIQEKPTTISQKTAKGTTIADQVVRLEADDNASFAASFAGRAPRREVTVFGVRDHPTVADTIIDEGNYFNIGSDRYTVKDVILTQGEVQAVCEATR